LIGTSGKLVAYQETKNSGFKEVTSATFAITPNPGTCAVSPAAAPPGTPLSLSGTGASPGAALSAVWFDALNCSCWLAGCSGCTFVKREEPITADASGNFSGTVTPAAEAQGYCVHALTIQDKSSGAIVATSSFNFCQ